MARWTCLLSFVLKGFRMRIFVKQHNLVYSNIYRHVPNGNFCSGDFLLINCKTLTSLIITNFCTHLLVRNTHALSLLP